MKIAYIISEVYSMGGAPKITIDKLNNLVSRGHQLYLITERQLGKASYYDIDDRVKCYDIGIDFNTVNQISNPIKRFWIKKKYASNYKDKLESILSEIKVDICVQVYFTLGASILPSINDGSRKVLESHGIKYALLPQIKRNGLKKLLSYPLEIWQRYKYERIPLAYDHFVCLTKEYIQEWPKIKNKSYIYNFINIPNDEVVSLDSKNVVFLGRLSEEKNISDLLRIWKVVVEKDSEWTLKIVGDGPMLMSLRELCNELDLCSRVQFIPASQNVREIYLDSSIVVLTSLQEGFPMTLIEAQYFGIPIISYSCSSGPRSIISDSKNGFLVPMLNKEVFADRLLFLIKNPDQLKEMGRNAKEVSKSFEVDSVIPQWEYLFNELMRRKDGV